MNKNLKLKKYLLPIIVIITIPFWLTLINYVLDFVIQAGRVTGTYIRVIGSDNI